MVCKSEQNNWHCLPEGEEGVYCDYKTSLTSEQTTEYKAQLSN